MSPRAPFGAVTGCPRASFANPLPVNTDMAAVPIVDMMRLLFVVKSRADHQLSPWCLDATNDRCRRHSGLLGDVLLCLATGPARSREGGGWVPFERDS